jgi:membrane-associated phospholipid phosphatase
MELLADAVSMTFTLGLILPGFYFLATQDFYYIGVIGAVLGANALVMGIKPFLVAVLGSHDPWIRPIGARNCNALGDGGASGGRPGFPSGHMTTATVCVSALWLRDHNPLILWLGIPWIVAMGWARWAKQCHNWQQILGGIAFGVTCAAALHWFYAQ